MQCICKKCQKEYGFTEEGFDDAKCMKDWEEKTVDYNCVKDGVVHLTTEDWLACKDCHIEENHASNRSDPI